MIVPAMPESSPRPPTAADRYPHPLPAVTAVRPRGAAPGPGARPAPVASPDPRPGPGLKLLCGVGGDHLGIFLRNSLLDLGRSGVEGANDQDAGDDQQEVPAAQHADV